MKQHLDSLLDERLRAGIFLRREHAELSRHVGRDVGADVLAPLPAGGRQAGRMAGSARGTPLTLVVPPINATLRPRGTLPACPRPERAR